jgi:hypothetical protein
MEQSMKNLASRAALFLAAALAVSMGLAAEPFPSTYQVPANPPLLVQGATVLTGTGARIGNPFSVYALAEQVFIDGALIFDREHPQAKPRSDFLLGQPNE